MSQFLYYVPGLMAPVTSEAGYGALLDRLGLGAVLDGTSAEWRHVTGGPDAGSGELFVAAGKDQKKPEIAYMPGKQRWIRCEGHWLGYWLEDPPVPQELSRSTPLDARLLELGDGNLWNVPIALYGGSGVALPETFGVADDGTRVRKVQRRYVPFHEAAAAFYERLAQGMAEGTGPDIDDDAAFELAVLALGEAYRVGRLEIEALELLTTGNLSDVCHAAVGVRLWREIREAIAEAEKKTECVSIPG